MMKKYLLLIVEGQGLFEAGLNLIAMPDLALEISGKVDNCADALRLVQELKPDLILMDLSMLGHQGIKAIGTIKRNSPQTKIVVLTSERSEVLLRLSLKAGANGYMVKDMSADELRIAIRTVLKGKLHLSPDITDLVIGGYLLSEPFPGNFPAMRTFA